MTDSPQKTKRIVLVVILLAIAAGVWIIFGGNNELDKAEVAEGLRGKTILLRCSACNETFEMPAEDYAVAFEEFNRTDAGGLKCLKCGALKAWQVGIALKDFDPQTLSGVDLSTRDAVEDQIHSADIELSIAKDELAAAETDGDPAKIEAAKSKVQSLKAKVAYLYDLWDQREMENVQGG